MGKKSRAKKESTLSGSAKKVLKDLLREAKAEPFSDANGNIKQLNILKKILKGETYSTDMDQQTTSSIIQQYQRFLAQKMREANKPTEN